MWQHWFRKWLGAEVVPSHYLNQSWYVVLTHVSVTRPQWVKNACWSYMKNNKQNTSQFCACHDSWVVVAAELTWHAKTYHWIRLLETKWHWEEFSQDFNHELIKCLWNGSLIMSYDGICVLCESEWVCCGYRDCKSGRHILWHCTSSLWSGWHATNLDIEIRHGHLSHHPVLFWPSRKGHNHVPHDVHWWIFLPITAVKPQWKV